MPLPTVEDDSLLSEIDKFLEGCASNSEKIPKKIINANDKLNMNCEVQLNDSNTGKSEEQKYNIKQEPESEPEPELEIVDVLDDNTTNSKDEVSNFTFCLEKNAINTNENVLFSSANVEYPEIQDYNINKRHKNSNNENETLSHSSVNFNLAVQEHEFNTMHENSRNKNENLSFSNPKYAKVQDRKIYRNKKNSKNSYKSMSILNTDSRYPVRQDCEINRKHEKNKKPNKNSSFSKTNPYYPVVQDLDMFRKQKNSEDANKISSFSNTNSNYPVIPNTFKKQGNSTNTYDSVPFNDLNSKYPVVQDCDNHTNHKNFMNAANTKLLYPNSNPNYAVVPYHEMYREQENSKNTNENVSFSKLNPDYPVVQNLEVHIQQENSKSTNESLSFSSDEIEFPVLQNEDNNRIKENIENANENLSFPDTNPDYPIVQDHDLYKKQKNSMDMNQNKSFPNIVTEYHIKHENDDDAKYNADQDNATNTENNKWNPCYQQFRTSYSEKIPPLKKNRNHYNNYNQSDRWQLRRDSFYSSSSSHKKNGFSKMFKNNSQDRSSFASFKNFTSSKFIPPRPTQHFTQPNIAYNKNFYNKNYRMRGYQFGPRMPFTRNNKGSSNCISKINNSTSSNYYQFKSKNSDQLCFNNLKQPAPPSVSTNKSSHTTGGFKKPLHLHQLPVFNQQTENDLLYEDTTLKKSESNSGLLTSDPRTLSIQPTLFYGSENKEIFPRTNKIIDNVLPDYNKKNMNDNGENNFCEQTIQPYDDNCDDTLEPGEIVDIVPGNDKISEFTHGKNYHSLETTNFYENHHTKEPRIQLEQHDVDKNKFLNIEEKIDVFPVNSKKNMVVNDKNQFNKETINSSNINCLVEPGIQFEQHYIVKDYLSPVKLVGCTVKFVSRKLANTSTRENILEALNSHGVIEHSWWTPDDMFFVSYVERSCAKHVFQLYPKNTTSSY